MRHLKSRADKKIRYLLPVGLFLLSGCMSQGNWSWQHPQGLGQTGLQQAVASCEALAAEESNRHDYFYPYSPYLYSSYDDRHDYRDRRFFYSSYFHNKSRREFQERQRYFRICMKAKDWKMVKDSAARQAIK